MEMVESCVQDEDAHVSIPLGGPIYVPNLVGPITGVADFEASVLQHLEDLKAEICPDSSQACEEDISVDELKIFTEEELVNKAFEEAFKDGEEADNSSQISEEHSNAGCKEIFYPEDNSSQLSEEHSNAGRKDNCRISSNEHACLKRPGRGRNTSASFESLNDSPSGSGCNGKWSKNNSRKRKRRVRNNRAVEVGCLVRSIMVSEFTIKTNRSRSMKYLLLYNSYIAKVEQLAKVRQKQDEDKAAARLHSFNGSCKINECAVPSSEKIERMISLRSMSSVTKVKSSSVREHAAVTDQEVVLCVEVYHNIRTWAKTQEFLVLGRQTLTELRDNIYCLTDQVMQKAGQHDPSGYFLIEDDFYNDLRDPSAIEYSKPIFDWLRNSKDDALEKWEFIISGDLQRKQKALLGNETISHLPHFRAFDMHNKCFRDLEFRLGAGYLYCHQGDCKHTIVIRDMRLIHPEDVHNRAAYPIVTFQQKIRFQKCSVCRIYLATKVAVDDKWAQANPCYFCDNCYYLLHYSKDGSLLYSGFEVYDYHHD